MNAAIYIRVSTTRQGEQGVSTETQRADLTARVLRDGWQVARVEEDHATGTNFDRAGYQAMLEAAKRGEIQRVYVYSLDRFGRDQLGARIALQELNRAGAELHTVEGLVKDDLLFTIIGRVSEFQSAQTSEKVTRNLHHRASTGHWSGLPPFGYDVADCPDVGCGRGKKLAPNAKGTLVTEVARRFDGGQRLTTIQTWLREQREIVDVGWIARRLRNPVYAGDVLYGRRSKSKFHQQGEVTITTDAHPALIDREVFERIQSRFGGGTTSRPETRPYDGLLMCGQCGSPMYRVPGGKKPYHYYYVCRNRHAFRTCGQQRIPYRMVEETLDAQIDKTFPNLRGERRDIMRRLLALVEPDVQRLLRGSVDVRAKLEAEVKKLERQQETVYGDRLEGVIPADLAAKKLADIGERIKGAKQEMKTLKHTMSDFELDESIIELRIPAMAQVERELIRLLVARITATGATLTVDWQDYAQSLVKPTDGTAVA